jgi:hypothetical protein
VKDIAVFLFWHLVSRLAGSTSPAFKMKNAWIAAALFSWLARSDKSEYCHQYRLL